MDDADRLAGQLLVVGFRGTVLPGEVATALGANALGGVILFKRNLPDLETTWRLTTAIARAAGSGAAPFVAVDQEGGRVARLPSPARKLPPARALGARGDAALTERAGHAVGAQLARLGFNLDFAPVLDVDSNPENPVIGDRAYSADAAVVAVHGGAFAAGLGRAGVLACGKHFPGHGDTAQDSHFALPRVAHDRARLDAVELAPFRALAGGGAVGEATPDGATPDGPDAGRGHGPHAATEPRGLPGPASRPSAAALATLPTLMTAHVVYDALDAGVPATLSARVCTALLRGEYGFSGVLFSDDLEMKALADHGTTGDNAVRSVLAGCDVLLVCAELTVAAEARTALAAEIRRSPAFRARAEEAVGRALTARRAHPLAAAATLAEASAAPELDAVLGALGG